MSGGSVLIKGGRAVVGDDVLALDVLIENGTITGIGPGLTKAGVAVEDATGMYVLPGAIDPHVHFGWPGAADDFAIGSAAAACGGVTSVLEFSVQFPGDELQDSVDRWRQLGSASVVDFGLHAIVSDSRAATLAAVPALVAQGVASFKMFMTSQHSGGLGVDDGTLFAIMREVAAAGGISMAHCENDAVITLLGSELISRGVRDPVGHLESRPPFVEAEAVGRAIALAAAAGSPFYVPHLSSRAALEVVERARSAGQPVIAETCPQFLALTDEVYSRQHGERFVMSPPIKSSADQSYLWNGLVHRSVLAVGSDHCPYPSDFKEVFAQQDFRRIPNGVPGVETLLPILYTFGVVGGILTLPDVVRIASMNPAEIFGFGHRKGSLTIGYDGDVAVIDPGAISNAGATRLHSALDYSIYEGVELRGMPVLVIGRGDILSRDGSLAHQSRRGVFIERDRPALGSELWKAA